MKTMLKLSIYFIGLALIAAVMRSSVDLASAATFLYVSPGGSDSQTCLSPTTACATIPGALTKAVSGDSIKVATGTYTGSGTQVVFINKNVTLSGGWDVDFITQTSTSTIDGQNARDGIRVDNGILATVDRFTVENGASDGGVGIMNDGTFTLTYGTVQNNPCGSGIINNGTMTIFRSTIKENSNACTNQGNGGGIYQSDQGPLTIIESMVSDNQAGTGAGIYAHGPSVSIVNSNIVSNTAAGAGGGVYIMGFSGEVYSINNSTIASNRATSYWAGGIFFENGYGGVLTLKNTILAQNVASGVGQDCLGVIGSDGYNLISDTTDCIFNSTTGDQLNVDPKLGPLQDNGGPTLTQWLYANSPAIDGGNPAGCTDHLGNPLTTDQRGFTRPLDGDKDGNNICDIGAYEANPDNLPQPPATFLWYVTPAGNDENDCHTAATPCATINGAIGKASPGDIVYVSTGVYSSPSGSEVVLVDKSITLSGGWNLDFTYQAGYSDIDGGYTHRGVTIEHDLRVTIEQLNIYHGLILDQASMCAGGGVYINYNTKAILTNLLIHDNEVGGGLHLVHISGGGICTEATLTLNDSLVYNNVANRDGGGIKGNVKLITINRSKVYNNTANDNGGGIASLGDIVINDSAINYNYSIASGMGGGIYTNGLAITLNRTTVQGNNADQFSYGGGIYGNYITLNKSLILQNEAGNGGGIYNNVGDIILNGSTIMENQARGSGGGIQNNDHLYLINSSILFNQAAGYGGGLFAGVILASNTMIAGNISQTSGGGIYNNGPITLRNTILAQNQAPAGPDCTGTVSSAGYILVGNTSGCTINLSAGDLLNEDPHFMRLFGWPPLLPLMADSPAIDGGNPAGCTDHLGNPITTDQRGNTRPVDGTGSGFAICDIGSYEYDPAHLPHWIFLPLTTR
jgi:hypothetical protein